VRDETLARMVTDVSDEQYEKAYSRIVLTLLGIVIDASDLQLLNA